jgi:hypothetical protein
LGVIIELDQVGHDFAQSAGVVLDGVGRDVGGRPDLGQKLVHGDAGFFGVQDTGDFPKTNSSNLS